MACIGVTTTRTEARLLEAGADWVVDSLEELNVEELARLS